MFIFKVVTSTLPSQPEYMWLNWKYIFCSAHISKVLFLIHVLKIKIVLLSNDYLCLI